MIEDSVTELTAISPRTISPRCAPDNDAHSLATATSSLCCVRSDRSSRGRTRSLARPNAAAGDLARRCPAFKILTYFGTTKERKLKRAGWSKPNSFHVCITTYTLILQVRAARRGAARRALGSIFQTADVCD